MFSNCIAPSLAVIGACFLHASSSEEVTIPSGGHTSIPCPLLSESSSGGSSLQWLLQGRPVVLDPGVPRRRWRVGADGRAALVIADARPEDAGHWECREIGPDGGERRRVKVLELVVGSSPSEPHLELEGHRLAHQATVTAKEPQHLALHCVVHGAMPPVRDIHWTIGDSNVTSWSELFVEFSSAASTYTSRSVLSVNATRQLHGRELVCKVKHDTWLQAAAVSAALNVLYEPSFSISRDPGFGLPLLSGFPVSLQCEVDANPSSDPLWVRDDPLPADLPDQKEGFLNFTPARVDDSGWYRCTTEHRFGFFASFGYFLNVRGSDVPVQSAASGSGEDSDFLPDIGNPNVAGCIPGGFPEVVAVNGSPSALEGHSALLMGQLCSRDALGDAFWVIGHAVLRPGERRNRLEAHVLSETEVPNCWLGRLSLNRVRVEDSGEILLVGRNTRGLGHASFRLNVTHAALLASSSFIHIGQSSLLLISFLFLCLFPLDSS